MPTKISKKKQKEDLKGKILELYLQGKDQKEILKDLKGELPEKKLKVLIKENYFLSPKNFRLGALLLFILTLLTPPVTVYIRGFEYRPILTEIILTSVVFAFPFAFLAIFLWMVKDLKKFYFLAIAFIFYLVVYIFIFLLISNDLKIWTLAMFPIILLPTFVEEFFKLKKLISTISL